MSGNMDQADPRPRIWIWPVNGGFTWAFHPDGNRVTHGTLGQAFEDAIAAVEGRPAVVIWRALI
jgi:hypothetical protein